MRIHDLLELASLLTVNGPLFVEFVPELPLDKLEQYWAAAHCRTDRWVKHLYEGERQLMQVPLRDRPAIWDTLEPTAVEVLTTDVLTRIWSALLLSWDQHHHADDATPIARSCFLSQLEARNRVMQLMVKWRGAATDLAHRWNRLRRTTERTTDMLLATLPSPCRVESFSFEPQRVQWSRREWQQRFFDTTARTGTSLLAQTLLRQLETEYPGVQGHADLNSRLASSILGCLHHNMFQGTGQLRALWQLRLYSTVTDVELLVDDASHTDASHTEASHAPIPVESNPDHSFVQTPHVRWRLREKE